MPHVIVKLWPGKSEAQKSRLTERIAQVVMDVLNYGDESVSVAFEEISAKEWKDKVYKPDILSQPEKLYKRPGYTHVNKKRERASNCSLRAARRSL